MEIDENSKFFKAVYNAFYNEMVKLSVDELKQLEWLAPNNPNFNGKMTNEERKILYSGSM